ncbi:uncharacterized protein LOC106076738 isoform X2 [Biomphalaria glabrata]|uniref:Uncharacterized protein LOC106076738 isoform X2 n=1 Tax=Biomphalaria glabrata TaxID=6526 RepID=A0A9W3B1F7_BIOGL|nr:uncharacterized protein LOC106076738 isoform X2 [Biomphalaria glabrata]
MFFCRVFWCPCNRRRSIYATFWTLVIVVFIATPLFLMLQRTIATCVYHPLVQGTTKQALTARLDPIQTATVTLGDVEELTQTLERMLNITTNNTRQAHNRKCINIWFPCKYDNCSSEISNNVEERIWDILSPRFRLSKQQTSIIKVFSQSIPSSDTILLSAASSNHFNEFQAMVQNLHTVVYPVLSNVTYVFLDLGLTIKQRNLTEKACRCHVISFPFHLFPSWFKQLFFFHWKPIFILAAMMRANKLVIYQDSSINWKAGVTELLERADQLHLQLFVPNYFHNIPVATLKGMFDFMGEQPCTYLPFSQVPANFAIFKHTQFVIKAILQPWAKCAFERDCLIPNAVVSDRNCSKVHNGLHSCHRFDQSAYSILLTKLFSTERYKYHMPDTQKESEGKYVTVDRARKNTDYFRQILQ